MRKIFNSIDIGTDTIKLVTAELYNGKYNILCTTSVKTSGVRQGLIVNLAGITKYKKKCIKLSENKLGTKIDKVIAVVPSQNINFDDLTKIHKINVSGVKNGNNNSQYIELWYESVDELSRFYAKNKNLVVIREHDSGTTKELMFAINNYKKEFDYQEASKKYTWTIYLETYKI